MTEANTPHIYYALVNKSGRRLRDPFNGLVLPVFDFPIQALKYAEARGINKDVYEIVNVYNKRGEEVK